MELTAVIVNYNSGRDLEELLVSLLNQRVEIEIIVVDNCSQDGSWRVALKFGERVKLLRCEENLGFAGAANRGIEASHSPFVAVLNPDTRFEPDYFEKLLNLMKAKKEVGMATGKILRFDRRRLDTTGQLRSLADSPVERGYGKEDRDSYPSGEVFSVCGAAALYRKKMLVQIRDENGYFDRRYFMFFEDFDLGWRARRAGWKAYYLKEAVGYHKRGARPLAFLHLPAHLRYHVIKNYWLTIIKNENLPGFLLRFPFILLRSLLYLLVVALTCPSVLLKLLKNLKIFLSEFKRRLC